MATDPDDDARDPEPDIDDEDAVDAVEKKIRDVIDEHTWIASCLAAIAQGLTDAVCSESVRYALDSLVITAAARAKRSLRSDLGRGRT
jgi:hypothetical protein